MITVYGWAGSSNAMKVFWLLEEIGLEYQLIEAGGPHGGNREASYLALNPNGTVPTLVDGDFILWESNTILRYLAARYGRDRFWIEDPARRADSERWMDWTPTFARPLIEARKSRPDQAAVARALNAAEPLFEMLQRQLETSRYIAGDELTLGDFPLAPWIYRYVEMVKDGNKFPALARYQETMLKHPIFARHAAQLN